MAFRSTTTTALASCAILFASSAASAQVASPPLSPTRTALAALPPPPAVVTPEHSSDSRMVAGIVLTGLGTAMIAGGAATFAGQCTDEICLRRILGLTAVSVGIAGTVVGVPLWVSGAVPPDPEYRSNAMRTAGIALTAIASGALAGGAVALTAGAKTNDPYSPAVPIGISLTACSAAIAAVGIPLWVVGAKPPAAMPAIAAGPRSIDLRWRF